MCSLKDDSEKVTTEAPGLFGSLPKELLEKIFVRSQNVDLPMVSRHFYQSLSSNFIRLRFCTHVFYHGKEPDGFYTPDHVGLAPVQTRIFRKKWFSNNFAKKVEREVLRLQSRDHLPMELPDGQQRCYDLHRVSVAFNTEIPHVLIQGTWTNSKVKLCNRLIRWGAVGSHRRDGISQGMTDAIAEQKPPAVRMLHERFRMPFTHENFRQAVFFGSNKDIVEMIVDAHANPPRGQLRFIDWDDEDVWHEGRCMVARENPQGQWLLDILESWGKSFDYERYGWNDWK